jgi:hypothetical protein
MKRGGAAVENWRKVSRVFGTELDEQTTCKTLVLIGG